MRLKQCHNVSVFIIDFKLTLLKFFVRDIHGLQGRLVGRGFVEDGIDQGLGLLLTAHAHQGQRLQDLAARKVRLLLQDLVGLLQSLLVVAVVEVVWK